MKKLFQAIRQLAMWQKAVAGAMLVLIVLTWLAVCLVLTGYLGP
jgi:hypothetical protein